MSYVIREIHTDHLRTDSSGNVLWMRAYNILTNRNFHGMYEEVIVFVSPAELQEVTRWYTECEKKYPRFEWPRRLEDLLCSGLSLEDARATIDAETRT